MILLSLGDPLSITIESILRLKDRLPALVHPIVLVGSRWHWQHQCSQLGQDLPVREFTAELVNRQACSPGFWFCDIDRQSVIEEDPRRLSPLQRGMIAYQSLQKTRQLIQLIQQQQARLAVFTAPIDKFACQQAGFPFPGQTEFFESLAGREGIMLLSGPKLKVGLVTNHLALSEVTAAITETLVRRKIASLVGTLQQIYKIDQPRIAVAALNPHAGDGGMFGSQDERILAPAVAAAAREYRQIVGPLPADTVFFRCYQGEFDAVLAMYHDQGLGPLKTVHFYDAVNITGGLPFLRVSPDHGPAANLYMQGRANLDSFAHAFQLASEYLS